MNDVEIAPYSPITIDETRQMSTTIVGPDGKVRCRWSDAAPDFLHYHDSE